jgi:hypothetical protein
MSSLAMVSLKDGSEVPELALITTTMRLEDLAKEYYIALYDLVKKCRDSNYLFTPNPFMDSKVLLKNWALIDQMRKYMTLSSQSFSIQSRGMVSR